MTREQIIKHWDVIQAYKNSKTIQVLFKGKWEDENNPQFYLNINYRIKPESKKRLPTIEKVKEWFMENRVFIHKGNQCFYRIDVFSLISSTPIRVCGEWYTIQSFCERYTHYDGSSLLIEEV